MKDHDMRSPLARAIGLGSANAGAGAWWAERVSAIALVPLSLWFVAGIIAHAGSNYVRFIAWIQSPVTAILMILLLVTTFRHTALGLQVVIEDYIHSDAKYFWMIAMRLACFGLAVAGVVAVLRIVLNG